MRLQTPKSPPSTGLTIVDVLIVIGTMALGAAVLLPQLVGRRHNCGAARCVNNLRQIGLAMRMWSNDHGDKFPWEVPERDGGSMEYVASGEVFRHFLAATNEVNSPKILACPYDTQRIRTSSFAGLNNTNLSYFVGLDAGETKPQTILSGDRNISGGFFTSNRIMLVTATNVLVWGKGIHSPAGKIGLGDGSVQQLSNANVQRQMTVHFQSVTQSLVRFALP